MNEVLATKNLTIKEAVEKCAVLKKQTGRDWFFKANKGTYKLVCGD